MRRTSASSPLAERVAAFIDRYRMLDGVRTLVAAVSGGPDSMVLLELLRELAPRRRLALRVAHLHHGLRGREADLDMSLVRNYCLRHGLPFSAGMADVRAHARRRRLSLETAAREARYAFLRRLARRTNAGAIALGHTADDQVETFLMRLLRGAGGRGLRGMMPARREGETMVIRPLLGTWRAEILDAARRRGIRYRTDSTNRDAAFLRNRVRLGLVPYLRRRYNPNVKELLRRTAETLGEEQAYIAAEAARRFRAAAKAGRDGIYFPLGRFLAAPAALRPWMLRLALGMLGARPEIAYADLAAALELCARKAGRGSRTLPGRMEVRREYRRIVVCRTNRAAPEAFECALRDGTEITIPPFRLRFGLRAVPRRSVGRLGKKPERLAKIWGGEGTGVGRLVERVSLDALPGRSLTLRSRRPGDRYRPLGARGARKLKRIMADEKLPARLRPLVPVIACGDEIVWVPGHRIAEGYRVTRATRRVLELRMEKVRIL